jgi:hypothetical protein
MGLGRICTFAALALSLLGCGKAPPEPVVADTGAKQAVQDFTEAIIRRDWPAAYALLLPETAQRMTPNQFAAAAESYRRNLGFDPQKIHLRSCEEHDAEAIAHVVFMPGTSHNRQTYRDGFTLRRVEDTWRIVLPSNFGRK